MDINGIGAFGNAVTLIVYAWLTILPLSGWKRSYEEGHRSRESAIAVILASARIRARDYARMFVNQFEVSSEVGSGAEFLIRLPVSE